eukprot:SAG22_NODE_863_length_6804_cov_3.086652_7_plen_114_part_00
MQPNSNGARFFCILECTTDCAYTQNEKPALATQPLAGLLAVEPAGEAEKKKQAVTVTYSQVPACLPACGNAWPACLPAILSSGSLHSGFFPCLHTSAFPCGATALPHNGLPGR